MQNNCTLIHTHRNNMKQLIQYVQFGEGQQQKKTKLISFLREKVLLDFITISLLTKVNGFYFFKRT